MSDALRLGLDAWIVQDGNYGDFETGDKAAFAVEFHAPELRAPHPNADPAVGATWKRDSTYGITGRVLHVTPRWWVLDIGLPIYNEHPLEGLRIGDRVVGEAYLGVDHFAYFERLALESDAPPLIHDWRIEAIDLDATPWVETAPRHFQRDAERVAWRNVGRTNAWKDDGGRAAYVLHCQRASEAPRRTLKF